ncbi:MAG: hypothetical protein QX190_04765 [Methylococcales bacterium]
MQISLNVPDNLPLEMVQSYLRTIEMQMQLFSQTITETNNQAVQLRQLFKETQNLPSVACLTDEDIANEIEQVRNGL